MALPTLEDGVTLGSSNLDNKRPLKDRIETRRMM